MDEMKFRAVIPERKCKIFFTLEDLVMKPLLKFSIREILIPWLQAGNKPDLFIGLHDCKGTEIYENDILTLDDTEDNSFCVIQFHDSGFHKRYDFGYGTTITKFEVKLVDWLVCGNTHENSDLLK